MTGFSHFSVRLLYPDAAHRSVQYWLHVHPIFHITSSSCEIKLPVSIPSNFHTHSYFCFIDFNDQRLSDSTLASNKLPSTTNCSWVIALWDYYKQTLSFHFFNSILDHLGNGSDICCAHLALYHCILMLQMELLSTGTCCFIASYHKDSLKERNET